MTKYYYEKNLSEKISIEANIPFLPFVRHKLQGTSDDNTYKKFREKEFKCLEEDPIIDLTDQLDASDFILLPIDYSFIVKLPTKSFLNHYIKASEDTKKPIIISYFGDSTEDVKINRSIILRHSKYRNELKKNEIICPPLISNLTSEKKFKFIKNPKHISIGFVGHALKENNPVLRFGKRDYVYNFLGLFNDKYSVKQSGLFFRQKSIDSLLADDEIICDFKLRDFWGRGRPMWSKGISLEVRNDFLNNIDANLFNLAVKGAGNYSFRFFEILSAGRIPLLIDTLCALPASNIINYADFCVIVDFKDIKNTSSILKSWFYSKTPEQILNAQIQAKQVYKDFIDFRPFMSHIFKNEISRLASELY